MASANGLRRLLSERVVFLDGGCGTLLMEWGMPPGVPTEKWALGHGGLVRRMHREYVEAGADVVLTCTFGGTAAKLGSDRRAAEACSALARIALEEVGDRAVVAASMGPTGLLMRPSGELDWASAYRMFSAQAEALAGEGIEAFFLETFSDPGELKAAVLAVRDAVPDAFVSAQMSFERGGVSLTGCSPTALALLAGQLPVDAVGTNCGTGPEAMLPVTQQLVRFSGRPVVVEPNAGLPTGGRYELSPERMAGWAEDMAWAGASVLGGCCGTTPAHVEAMVRTVGRRPAEEVEREELRALTSMDRIVPLGRRTLAVGESINPTGRRRLRASLRAGDFMAVTSLARAQGRADVIDVNLGLERMLPEGFVSEVFSRLAMGPPLSVDLSSPGLVREAFESLAGIALLNSLTCEPEVMERLVPVLLRHGGYAVLLPLDAEGPGETPEERVAKLERGIRTLGEMGLPAGRIVADPVVTPVGSGGDAGVTIRTHAMLKERGLLTIAGISNVSHGLPERSVVNAALLSTLVAAGLDLAIMDVLDPVVLGAWKGALVLTGGLDPVEMPSPDLVPHGEDPDFWEILRRRLITGDRRGVSSAARELLESGEAAGEILERGLAAAMSEVGRLYSERKLFLPHLIAAAEAASDLMGEVTPHLKESDRPRTGRVVLATVRGDVHSIGKDLVGLFLRNAGFEVIDLGTDAAAELIVSSAREERADLIALSALMSTTAPEMEKVIGLVSEELPGVPVLVGGAVVGREYAEAIGASGYAADAPGAVDEARRLTAGEG